MTNPSQSGRQPPPVTAQHKTAKAAPRGATGSSPIQRPSPGSTGTSPTQRALNPVTASVHRPGSDRVASRPSDRHVRTGQHAPVRAGSGPRATRQGTSDRQTSGGGRPVGTHGQPRIALRMKFTLVMAGVTAIAMIVLGLTMSQTTQRYLFGQKTQSGIEIAKMATVIAGVTRDRILQLNEIDDKIGNKDVIKDIIRNLQKDIQSELLAHLDRMRRWGGSDQFTDIESISFNCPEVAQLSGVISGGSDNGTIIGAPVESLFIPKADLTLQNDELRKLGIDVYHGIKNTERGPLNILRFKIALPPEFGRVGRNASEMEPAHVRVDIAMASIDKVGSNLTTTILLGVLVAIVVVMGVAMWFSTSITRPLERLLRDMQIVSKGHLDHRTGASSNDEVGLLANEFNRMTASLEVAQAAVIEQEKAAYELSLAREVQQQLLPAQPPLITGFQCQSFYQGAKAVSGDYFDFIPLENGLWGFIIADVSGKGIPGSMVMAVTRTVVRLVAPRHGANAAETLKDTNRLIARQIKRGMFVTSFYAVLNENTGLLTYASAGHNPMVIYRAKTRTHELATTKGIALGFNEGPVFDRTIQQAETMLGRGDTVVLYTDGFPEAMNDDSEEFGEDNFYRLIAANGHLEGTALVEAVVSGVAQHRADAEQSDDLTMLTVRRS